MWGRHFVTENRAGLVSAVSIQTSTAASTDQFGTLVDTTHIESVIAPGGLRVHELPDLLRTVQDKLTGFLALAGQ
ncbi:hypothetical protein OOK58_05845 [Streptomyces sp. NBC_01728]|nr:MULTISPECIES: hypothetical protein [unclassified Streptomyces]MCX4462105.1 hypothetical protein [Streptomyces sp. NBC_01719]MCX4491013.1 hypothetical protein [Streptomyces sp. NBC_01728]